MAPYPLTLDGSEISKAFFTSTMLKRAGPLSHPSLSDGSKPQHNYNPGTGSKSPQSFNNKAYFALFAILGAGMVLTSIWFFFWAKNGGFVWRSNDWDDYKSTVLRRKGKDGKTLTNATPATDLGEKSIAGTFDVERDNNMHDYTPRRYNNGYNKSNYNNYNDRKSHRPPKRREASDDDLRAYRHEKPARVGGLNREQDGSHFDFTSSPEPSEVVSNNSRIHLAPKGRASSPSPKKKGFMEKKRERAEEKKVEKKMKHDRKIDKKNHTAGRRSHTFAADELSDAGAHADPYSPHYRRSLHPTSAEQRDYPSYRPTAPPHSPSRRHEAPRPYNGAGRQNAGNTNGNGNQPRQSSPLKGQPRFPGSFDAYEEDDAVSDTGTKVYAHHIPQLSRGSRAAGFRRGGRPGRRNSLSDSENGDLGGRRG